ncbi:MAG: methylenetetrahydrofolate reductase [NAD(P)H] [Verrucomicrobiota bacterium]|nr:methylenetetrahydrofolate reductase [NAD(P)H] [Verrucomicrobiota bacterium]
MFKNRPITDYLATTRPVVSVEFFPPKNEESARQIIKTADELKAGLKPDFVSITYGAGGGTRERTLRYARILKNDYQFQVMPHLTCVGSTRAELVDIIKTYQDEGFCNLMALRGDPPKGETNFVPHPDGLKYASELVHFIREQFAGFSLGVAGYPEVHPEAANAEIDIANLKHKCEQGASFITTQLFFDNQAFFKFKERCRAAGIVLPIIPGILPALSLAQVKRFCTFCQASVPAELERQLAEAGNDEAAGEAVGVAWAAAQIRELLAAGAPGVHLYVMNRSSSALALMREVQPLLPNR